MSTRREKDLSDLEKLLAALPPRPTTLDRDHLLFRAGQASMRRSWIWPFVAVIMSAATGCLAMYLFLRPAPEPIMQIVQVHVPAPAPPVTPEPGPPATQPPAAPPAYGTSSAMSYWQMQQQALLFGVENLPSPTTQSAGEPERRAPSTPDMSTGARPKMVEQFPAFPFGVP
jgi:hypothetical protein